MTDMKKQPALRDVCTRLGFALIIQNILIQTLYSGVILGCQYAFPFPDDRQYVIINLAEGACYLFCFMVPVLLFRIMMHRYEWQPMRLGIKAGPDTVLAVPFGIAAVLASAIVNDLMFSWVDVSGLMTSEAFDTPIKILCNFVTMALVPAVCEEFLFRGCVLSNLLPFGKTTAVIGSALLFALMHSNPLQFLYAFCAGIVLGLLYLESGSVWPGMFMHLFNNLFSVFEETLYGVYPEDSADKIVIISSLAIFLAGIAAGTVLILRRKGKIVSGKGGSVPTFRSLDRFSVREFERPAMAISNILNLFEGAIIIIWALIG